MTPQPPFKLLLKERSEHFDKFYMTTNTLSHPNIAGVLPVYNTATYLRECLDSLVHQTYKNFTLFITDDGSTDGSSEILSEYQKHHPFIKVIKQDNQGVSSARNSCLQEIEASNIQFDLIAFFDADDYYDNHYLEEMVKPFTYHPDLSFVSAGWCNFDKNGPQSTKKFPNSTYSIAESSSSVIDQFFCQNEWKGHPANSAALNNKVFDARFIRGRRFDTSLKRCEDQDWLLPLLANAKQTATVNRLLFFRRRRKSSLSHATKSWLTDLKVFHRLYQRPDIQKTYLHECLKSKLIDSVWNEMRCELDHTKLTPLLLECLALVRTFSLSSVDSKQQKRLAIIKLGNSVLRFAVSRATHQRNDSASFD